MDGFKVCKSIRDKIDILKSSNYSNFISDATISKAKISGYDVILSVGNGSLTVKNAKGKSMSLIDSFGNSFSTILGVKSVKSSKQKNIIKSLIK